MNCNYLHKTEHAPVEATHIVNIDTNHDESNVQYRCDDCFKRCMTMKWYTEVATIG